MNFTNDEMNLMCIYDAGSRSGVLEALKRMSTHLTEEDDDLRRMTDFLIIKLSEMTDEEYNNLELYPDFGEEDANGE